MIQTDNSLLLESDCHQFDVCQDTADLNHIFLYEVYIDELSFRSTWRVITSLNFLPARMIGLFQKLSMPGSVCRPNTGAYSASLPRFPIVANLCRPAIVLQL